MIDEYRRIDYKVLIFAALCLKDRISRLWRDHFRRAASSPRQKRILIRATDFKARDAFHNEAQMRAFGSWAMLVPANLLRAEIFDYRRSAAGFR